jgi:hypothetical protein
MPLWSNVDEANSAPQYTVDITTGNTGVQAYNVEPIGTWGVDTDEARASNVNGHAGWVLRTVGSGGRAGRVNEETLVAMGSMTGDGEDDDVYPDAVITIITEPQDTEAVEGNDVELSVVATIVPEQTLSYQWYNADGDVELEGENSDTLLLEDVSVEDSGDAYYVVVSAGDTEVQSDTAELTVVEATVEITLEPQDATADVGDNVTFSVVATTDSDLGLEYQWYNATGDVLLTGEESDELFLESVALADSGNIYYVVVSSGSTEVQSANAELTVVGS